MALTATVTPGKTFLSGELVTNSKLNQAAAPTVTLAGTADSSQITNDSVTADKAQFGAWFYCSASTSSNVITLTATGHTITLVAGMIARFEADATNTAAVDITFGGSTTNLFRYYNDTTSAGVELAAGDIRDGQMVEVIYDGAHWQMLSPIGNNAVVVGTDAGSTDDYAITPSPSVSALADITGVPVVFQANTINTGAATLAVSGLAATPIVKSYDGTLDTGDIKAGQWVCVTFDGTNFQLLSPVTPASSRATLTVRQTVLTGPVDTNGHAQLLSYSGQNITLAATSGSPLVVAFAAGYDTSGAVDYINRLTSNVSNAWTLPTVNATYYLFTDRDASTGAITYGYTTTRPTYTEDDAASITSGAHTFLINEMQMYLGDGAAAATKQRVFIGESVVGGGAVTSVTSYMFRGRFKSSADIATTLDNSVKTDTHKLGLLPRSFRCVLVCQNAVQGYAVEDEMQANCHGYLGVNVEVSASATTLSTRAPWLGATYAPYIQQTAAAGLAALVAADWKWRFYAERGW